MVDPPPVATTVSVFLIAYIVAAADIIECGYLSHSVAMDTSVFVASVQNALNAGLPGIVIVINITMQMIYNTAGAFRPIGEKTWWAVKGTGRGVYSGVKWVVPYAGMAVTGTFHGIQSGYGWLAPRVRGFLPLVYEKAKELASRSYAWIMPQVRYVTPLAIDTMAKAGNAASSALLSAVGAAPVQEEEGEMTAPKTTMSYFVNLTVPAWEKIAKELIDEGYKACIDYKDLVLVFRLPDGSIARVGFRRSSFKSAFVLLGTIGMKYGIEFDAYPINMLEVLAPHEVQVMLNADGPERLEGYIKSLSYYRLVIANLPIAEDMVKDKIPTETTQSMRDRERD